LKDKPDTEPKMICQQMLPLNMLL